MKNFRFIYLFYILNVIQYSCGGSSTDEPPVNPLTPEVLGPTSVNLLFPDNNTECHEGIVNVNDETKSSVTFQWTGSENTDSYEIKLKNLDSGSITTATSISNEKEISINRATLYEWYVISIANGTTETARSETWAFYNQGPGIENYAPFPAEAIYPKRGSTISNNTAVNLEWSSIDLDNDIISYELFFGTTDIPVMSLGNTSDNSMEVSISSGNVYFWKIVTRDELNNTSNSEIFSFGVD